MMKAGAAQADITCPVGTSLAGYFEDRFSTAVHDPLLAYALVLTDGRETAAIVTCDLVRHSREIVEKTRAIASKATGIPERSILLCATHIHTGPDTVVRNVQLNPAYLDTLPGIFSSSIIEAHKSLRPVTLRLGEEQDRTGMIRRFRMKSGREAFNPGFLNPDIIGPVGEIDPQVSLLRVDDDQPEPYALLGNYAMHPDCVGGNEICADWPGMMCDMLRKDYNERPVAMFAQGACGNVSHNDFTNPKPLDQKGFAAAERIARTLAGKMLAASEKSEPMESDVIRVASKTIEIPFHPLTPALIERAREIRRMENAHPFDRKQADIIEHYDRDGKNAQVEIQVIRVGDTALVAVPCEYFVDWGLEIKHWSPFKQTFICELANGWFGYVGTMQAYYRGGYEVQPILSAQLVPEAGLRIADTAIELLRAVAD